MLVERYEQKRWPIGESDAVEVLTFMMEQQGKTLCDLAVLLGDPIAAHEVLHRKRYLTLPQIWQLEKDWHIPAGALVGKYDLVPN